MAPRPVESAPDPPLGAIAAPPLGGFAGCHGAEVPVSVQAAGDRSSRAPVWSVLDDVSLAVAGVCETAAPLLLPEAPAARDATEIGNTPLEAEGK